MDTVGHPEVSLTKSFHDSLGDLPDEDAKRCREALHHFVRDPSHPGLQFGKLQGMDAGRLCKIRAARDVRIILAREGNLYFPVLAGFRDQIYERAARGRFVIDRVGEVIRFVEPRAPEERTGSPAAPEPWTGRSTPDVAEPGLLTHWTDGELVEAGLDEVEVATIRGLESAEELLELIDGGWDEVGRQYISQHLLFLWNCDQIVTGICKNHEKP